MANQTSILITSIENDCEQKTHASIVKKSHFLSNGKLKSYKWISSHSIRNVSPHLSGLVLAARKVFFLSLCILTSASAETMYLLWTSELTVFSLELQISFGLSTKEETTLNMHNNKKKYITGLKRSAKMAFSCIIVWVMCFRRWNMNLLNLH